MKKIAAITLIVALAAITCDNSGEFTVDDFNITGLSQLWDGDPKAVDITPKDESISANITIFYNGMRTPPSQPGRYRVTFNADAAGFNTARGLSAGTLVITLVTDSTSVLRTQLIYSYGNTIEYPIPVKLNIELTRYSNCINIIAESDRYVELDLSDAIGTTITGQPFSELDYSKIVSIVLPTGLSVLGDFAMANLTGITHLDLSASSITHIGDYTFFNCNLEEIVLPLHLEEIGSFSFFNNHKLQSITIPNSVVSIREWSFTSTGIKTLAIGSGVTYIGRQAFYGTPLTNVTFSNLISNFEGSVYTFPGDLQEKFLEGGVGTYTRPDVNSYTWSKK